MQKRSSFLTCKCIHMNVRICYRFSDKIYSTAESPAVKFQQQAKIQLEFSLSYKTHYGFYLRISLWYHFRKSYIIFHYRSKNLIQKYTSSRTCGFQMQLESNSILLENSKTPVRHSELGSLF